MTSIAGKIAFGFVALALLALTSGCNTVEGAGKDVSATGKAMSDEAKEQKQKM